MKAKLLESVAPFLCGLVLGALGMLWGLQDPHRVEMVEASTNLTAEGVVELCQQIERSPAAIIVFPTLISSVERPGTLVLGPKFEMAIKLPPIKEGTASDAVGDYLVHVVSELDKTGGNRWQE